MLLNTISIFLIGLIALLSPGPDFLLILRSSVQGGASSALRTASGVVAGCFIQIGCCILGISTVIGCLPRVYLTLRCLGAIYLVCLGLANLRPRHASSSPGEKSSRAGFVQGMLGNLLNPKFTLFLLGVFTQFTVPSTPLLERCLYGATLWLQAAAYWYALVLVLRGERIKSALLRSTPLLRPVLGVFLLALGAHILGT